MKHNIKITILLSLMFLVTQLIGLFIITLYQNPANPLPFGLQPPEQIPQNTSIISILFAFVFAIVLFFVLTKINAEKFIRLWFFVVTGLAIALAFKALTFVWNTNDIIVVNKIPFFSFLISEFSLISILVLIIGLFLAYIKVFKRNLLVHNFTELLIYPGIAAVFIPLLNVFGIIILLLAISIYDIWAVWKSQFMQKMAKYQIQNLKFFTGFFIPYASKKDKIKIMQIKEKYANSPEKIIEGKLRKAKIKINLAILGGGDIIFPIITAGVFYKIFNSLPAAFVIMASATIALLWLFVFARKGKFYPAMPFLTIGMYIGMIINWVLMALHLI